jgi:3-oxoacyl-[acyl-carrier-protein] synthase-3
MKKVIIRSIAKYVPTKVVTNYDLSKNLDTNHEWIKERTGMVERRIASENELTSDMAAAAGEEAIKRSGLQKSDIDCLILATCCPDQPSPSTACITQNKLGLNGIPAFDISAMCSGFLYGLQISQGLISSGIYKNILLIGSEKISQILDWTDRSTCILFGDGAGAAVIGSGTNTEGHELLGTFAGSDGKYKHLLEIPGRPGDKNSSFVQMQGKDIFKHAVRHLLEASAEVLKQVNLSADQITWMVPHQANIRILQTTAEKFNIPMERVVLNLEKYGNTSAASIPIALEEGACNFKKGDIILCPAFGGGITWAATLIRW